VRRILGELSLPEMTEEMIDRVNRSVRCSPCRWPGAGQGQAVRSQAGVTGEWESPGSVPGFSQGVSCGAVWP
jgi:hypothetical protein